MKKYFKSIVFISLVFFLKFNLFSQNPGGIPNATLWFKSSDGLTLNGNKVSEWKSLAATPSVTVSQSTASKQPILHNGSGINNVIENRFNYNQYLLFDFDFEQRLSMAGDIDLGSTNSGVSIYQVVGQDTGVVSIEWVHSSLGTVKMKGDGIYAITKSDHTTGSNNEFRLQDGEKTSFQAHLPTLRGTVNGIVGRYNGIMKSTKSNNNPDLSLGISIGSNTDESEYMSGGIGEFIFFNSTLNDDDNLKIESYLAIKYGITLGTTDAVSNYTSADGVKVWTGDTKYQNNVIGICRDDLSGLQQKQSHYYSDDFRIYLNTLANTNAENTGAFALDKSFIMVGSDTGAFAVSTSSPLPAQVCKIMDRKWKVVRTNSTDLFSVDIKPLYNADSLFLKPSKIRFLVDDDGNFSNATVANIPIVVENGYVKVNNIPLSLIPNNSTKYFTLAIAFDTLVVSAVGDTICENYPATIYASSPNADLLTWSYNGLTGNSLVIEDLLAGEYNFIVTATSAAECWKSAKDTAVVLVNAAPNVTIIPSDTIFCSGENVTIMAFGADEYLWSNNSTNSTMEFLAESSHQIFVIGKTADNCADTAYVNYGTMLCEIVIPNVITPNDDGFNDKFVITGIELFTKKEIVIYNRWGNVVFKTNDYQNDWDGEGNSAGVYYYVINVEKGDVKKTVNGTITILR